jgi:hypothetical protein
MADDQQITNGTPSVPTIPLPSNWTIDVQRGLAWTIVLVFGGLLLAMAMRVIFSGMPTDALELLKQGFNALINVVMVVVGFFFGSSKSSQGKDDTMNRIVEKSTSTQPRTGGPVAALPAPVIVVSWWSLLKPEEQAAIAAAAPGDPKVNDVFTALQSGKAEAPDLAYLVSKNLLTQDRANILQAA